MGEHWYLPELMREPRCELERPTFLQYLVIGGTRRLIGTGYVCDAHAGPPAWFDGHAIWHEHGPALCRWNQKATIDAQPFANVMPNDLNERTWQELCTGFRGEALERKVVMLHTWNWIPAPDGRYVHDNRAIPFLRAGLRVPDADELDSHRRTRRASTPSPSRTAMPVGAWPAASSSPTSGSATGSGTAES